MSEGTATHLVRRVVNKAEKYIPQVPKPKKKISLQVRLLWCGAALLIYMIMAQTPLYGATTPEFDFLAFARVIFASNQGTLVELGIAPIVTGGLLMQLLRGSDILKLDFKKPEDKSLFQTATKLVTYVVIVAEATIFGISVYGPGLSGPDVMAVLIGQLIAASVLIMFLDELIQKGWGLGSGISLFILGGVAQQILWSLFSPIPAGDGGVVGVLPYMAQTGLEGNLADAFFRGSQLPSIFGLLLTVGVVLVLVYTETIKIEIPIVSTKYRGFSAVYPIKLMYVSVIPVIFASALSANAIFIGNMLWSSVNPRNNNAFWNILFQFDPASPNSPIGGIVYYMTAPRGLEAAAADPLRAIGYTLFMMGIVVIFGRLWVELGGLSPKKAASNLLDADVKVPGFRRSNQPIENLLKRYIPSVTIISSLLIGFLAVISDILGVFGTGLGILLSVSILVNYYNLLIREQVENVMPKLGALLGRRQ